MVRVDFSTLCHVARGLSSCFVLDIWGLDRALPRAAEIGEQLLNTAKPVV